MTAAEELRHLRGEGGREAPPGGCEVDQLTFPGGEDVLAGAREVMEAVLEGREPPEWFSAQCVDDSAIETCTLDRWSLRAWRFWLEAENRRWWWWSAEVDKGAEATEIRFAALVRGRPYLKGSLEWLFKAAANA